MPPRQPSLVRTFKHRNTIAALWLMMLSPAAWSASPSITEPTAEFVYKYLLGEVAAQRGEFALAGQLFLDLAKQTRNAALAERATQAAALARIPQLAVPSAALWAELAPESTQAAEAASQMYIANGELSKALPQIEKVLSKAEVRPNAFMELNILMSKVANKQEVLAAVQQLAQPYPALAEAHFAIAQAAFFAQDNALMERELKQASTLKPGWEVPVQMRGQILNEQDPKAAIAYYRDFLNQHADADQVRLMLAKTLLAQKDHRAAKKEFTTLAEKHKNNPEMNVIVGLLALDAKEHALADQYLQQALHAGFNEPNKIYFNLGRSAAEQKDDARALQWYDKITPGEQFLAGRLAAAPILARSQGTDAAIAMLDNVDGLTPEQQALVIQTEASILNQAKRTQEAFELLGNAVKSFPDNTDVMYDYAMSAEKLGQFSAMEQTLYQIIKMKPDAASAYNALGYSYADRNLKLMEAKNLIETAVRLSPGDHYIMDSLGWVYYRLGDLNHASERLREAYAIQQDPEIAAHLAEVLWKQGQREEAQQILDQALQSSPDNDILTATAQKLKAAL